MLGKFFAIEGLDGSGKTTAINRLKEEFPDFVYTREPGGSEFGEMIRQVLLDPRSKNVPALPMLLGFMTSRASHFQELVLPALKEGKVVISDRFDASTFAFQLYGQENLDLEDLFWTLREEIVRTEEGRLYKPHYVYFRLSKEVAEQRRQMRRSAKGDDNHFDQRKNDFNERIFLGYEEFFKGIDQLAKMSISPSENKVITIDASRSIPEVHVQLNRGILKVRGA